jgi:hypothetical protein
MKRVEIETKMYRDIRHWLESCVKTRIRRFFITLGKGKAQDYKHKDNFYYEYLYDFIRTHSNASEVNTKIKYYKAKLVQLKGRRLQHIVELFVIMDTICLFYAGPRR